MSGQSTAVRGTVPVGGRPQVALPATPSDPQVATLGLGGGPVIGTREERVRQALAAIDWSAPVIVLWLPGTSEWAVNANFELALEQQFPGVHAAAVTYPATWQFESSVPEGIATLKAVLDAIRERAPGTPVLLAGQSQGAWIAGEVIADPVYAPMIARTAMFGHPNVAGHHFHSNTSSSVLEITNPGDPVGGPIRPADRQAAIHALTLVASGHLLRSVPGWLALGLRNPRYLLSALRGQAYLIPGLGALGNPHVYDADFAVGAVFLRTGSRIGRAAFPLRPDGTTPRVPATEENFSQSVQDAVTGAWHVIQTDSAGRPLPVRS